MFYQADKTALLVSRVLDMSDSFSPSLESLTTPSSDAFQDLLHFNQNWNLLGTTKCGSNKHIIMMNHPQTTLPCDREVKLNLLLSKKVLNQYNSKFERPMWHWKFFFSMARPRPSVEIISTWQNNSPERHNSCLLYHQSPHYAEVHKPERGRYSCRHMEVLQNKTGIPT